MPTITATKQPQKTELAYGPNIVTLTDAGVPPDNTIRFVCRVIDADTFGTASDARQLPNLTGYAHFNLSSVVNKFVSSNPDLEQIDKLATADYEIFNYKVDIGYSDGTDVFVTSTLPASGEFIVLNGRKPVYEVDWANYEDYVPNISFGNIAGNDVIQSTLPRQKALTSRHYDRVTGAEITDYKPTSLGDTEFVTRIKIGRDDFYTLSFLNDWKVVSGEEYSSFYNGIAQFIFYVFEEDNPTPWIGELENITANGGGPDTTYGEGLQPTGSFRGITVQTSNLNSFVSAYPDATHFYVVARGWSSEAYTSETEISEWYRFDFECGEPNDYDHIQVSWLNEFGFRDYFTFEKRNEYSSTTTQETYAQLNADWSSPTYTVGQTSRGERVFSNKLEEEYLATTRYLIDDESTYLKGLYQSSDVRVRFNGQDTFVPVILTSNQYTQRTFKKDSLFQHTITFRLANPTQLQNG